jgi:regulator of protease activity HflC (stomatin/prohibitin superfamily)
MAKTKKQLNETLRQKFLELITNYFNGEGEEVLRVKSNEIAMPTLDEDGNDEWIVITVKVPTGSRDDGEAYDGYGMAIQYAEAVAEKEAKAKADAEKKARKIARDEKNRQARAEAKAKAQAEKGEG